MAKYIYICEECALNPQRDAPTYNLRYRMSSIYNYQTEHNLFFHYVSWKQNAISPQDGSNKRQWN